MIDYVMGAMLGLLGLCILGTAALVIVVAVYIFRDMSKRKVKTTQCNWLRFSAMEDYSTSCKNRFYDASESGNPVTDSLTYCPYCGGRISTLD